jgi:hypothetical protein
MFVGYSPNHAGDIFRMWDPETKRVHVSRDIIWLNKMYFNQTTEWINVPRNNFTSNNDYDSDNVQLENENNNNSNEDEEISNEIEPINKNKSENNERITTRSGRVIRLPSQFQEELDNLLFEEEQERSKNDNLKSFWRSISKGSLMAERYSKGRVLEISFTFNPISDKDIH